MQGAEDRWTTLAAAVASAVMPALLVAGLVRLPLPGAGTRSHRPTDTALDVVFLRRAAQRASRSAPGTGNSDRNVTASAMDATAGQGTPSTRAAPRVDARATGWRAGQVDNVRTEAPLDLSVRDPAPPPRAHDALEWIERKRGLDPRTTRFDRAWVPSGNAVEQARFRSAALNAALGLFGGAPRSCSEVERRLRALDCLPLEADEGDAEALRRSID